MSNVSMLGLGAMGSRIASNLLKSGHNVTVWNRNKNKTTALARQGARVADTPKEAVIKADFVICMVRDDEASREIWLSPQTGALSSLPEKVIAIESSTLSLSWTRELAEIFKTLGICFLDAPVAGSRPQADAAKLIYFVGGEKVVFEKSRSLLEQLSAEIHYAGPNGAGTALKLVVNALFGVQVAVMAELLGLLKNAKININTAIEILTNTPVCSPATSLAAKAMLAANFSPMFPIELVEKDFGYIVDTTTGQKNAMPITEVTKRVFSEAIKQGYGNDNITGVAKLY